MITGREKFGPSGCRGGLSLEDFRSWSGLLQVEELTSLDSFYNPSVEGIGEKSFEGGDFFGGLAKALSEFIEQEFAVGQPFNLLATVEEPKEEIKDKGPEEFEFLGYDVVNQQLGHSVLVHLGWLIAEAGTNVNAYGLLPDLATATQAVNDFKDHFPGMETAEGVIVGIWRSVRSADSHVDVGDADAVLATK
ncbi:hypothetical protein ADIS_3565 [Lunatimonas lonarensis]|uniref:Uncharacterized protein n=1 Tax=Lunatimonas lonarensis TaxID=1232681 RepID=R7ZPG3_9BACT|nr:hypothetical protein ADIS_3565 [Lunatimonas lonarensis]